MVHRSVVKRALNRKVLFYCRSEFEYRVFRLGIRSVYGYVVTGGIGSFGAMPLNVQYAPKFFSIHGFVIHRSFGVEL